MGDELEYSLRTPEWSLILPFHQADRQAQLYVKPDDRWEVNDIRQHYLEFAEHLEGVLHEAVIATLQPGPLNLPALPDLDAETGNSNTTTEGVIP
jgi:hypothetical protein